MVPTQAKHVSVIQNNLIMKNLVLLAFAVSLVSCTTSNDDLIIENQLQQNEVSSAKNGIADDASLPDGVILPKGLILVDKHEGGWHFRKEGTDGAWFVWDNGTHYQTQYTNVTKGLYHPIELGYYRTFQEAIDSFYGHTDQNGSAG